MLNPKWEGWKMNFDDSYPFGLVSDYYSSKFASTSSGKLTKEGKEGNDESITKGDGKSLEKK